MSVKGSSGNPVISIDDFIKSNTRDDKKRDEGLKKPDDIESVENIRYGEYDVNLLDVYRPKNGKGKLPVIVSVHGGGWVYGNKEINRFYCMSLAQNGFAVVNFSYRLAPKYKHPTPFIDTNKVFFWVLEHAEEYGFDADNVFGVGDSVGANILGLYCALCYDEAFSRRLGVVPPKGFIPKAVGLNCGLFRMARGENEPLMDNLAAEYFVGGGTDREYADICLDGHLSAAFPPTFVMTARGCFLLPQAKPFYERLRSLGVKTEYRCYGDKENEPSHVFHINVKLPVANRANEEECFFFLKQLKKD